MRANIDILIRIYTINYFPNIINLVLQDLNVYIGMERLISSSLCQVRCRSECGIAMVSMATTVKIISFLLSSRSTRLHF